MSRLNYKKGQSGKHASSLSVLYIFELRRSFHATLQFLDFNPREIRSRFSISFVAFGALMGTDEYYYMPKYLADPPPPPMPLGLLGGRLNPNYVDPLPSPMSPSLLGGSTSVENSSEIFSILFPKLKAVAMPKLDSCLVRHLSVRDGTVVGPSSPLTKIWKMKNNGTISWPIGTLLVRVKGDSLIGPYSMELKIPGRGIRVDENFDITIDLIAPAVVGRYMSYWQMASPLGKKFGDEVRVTIQVHDAHSVFFSSSSSSYLNALKCPSFLQSSNGNLASSVTCSINGRLFDVPFSSNSPFSSSLIKNSAQPSVDINYADPPPPPMPFGLLGGRLHPDYAEPLPPPMLPSLLGDHPSVENSSHIFSILFPKMKAVAAPKLDSCLVRHLSVCDGTVVGPSSPLTKIWRMKNNGTISWLTGTRLVRLKGDSLIGPYSIELKIPERGIRVDEELDISIDLVAPAVVGRYMSYWQMASPLGKRFGDEVWVTVQVI